MTVVLPSHLTYGKVVARWIKAIGDTPEDPDKLPEAIAVQGKVIIVPNNKANVSLDNEGFANTYVGVAFIAQTARITPNLPVLYITKNRSK